MEVEGGVNVACEMAGGESGKEKSKATSKGKHVVQA